MMTRKDSRLDQADLYPSDTDPAVAMAIARGAESKAKVGDDEKIHIFWRVFGGALISVAALASLTLYNSLQSSIVELRSDLARFNEARGDFVRKDEFNSRISNNYERLSSVQTQNTSHSTAMAGLKSECDSQKERLVKQGADLETVRRDTAAAVEAMKKDVSSLEVVKEKLTVMAAELKIAREESLKARMDVERNQLADQERKARRDDQHKDVEKTLKELQGILQECQVKLARLEGPVKPKEPAKTADGR